MSYADDHKFLEAISMSYPNRFEVNKELVKLKSKLAITKGVEIFLSDVHGEHEAFLHVLRSGSGSIKKKLSEVNPDLDEEQLRLCATIIYYPEEKLAQIKEDHLDWEGFIFKILQFQLELLTDFSRYYTINEIAELIPAGFEEIVWETLTVNHTTDHRSYVFELLKNISCNEDAEKYVIAFSRLIQSLSISHVHIIGDVYDRGPGSEIIMDELERHHSVDFQWGNHDVIWMGAGLGSDACIANVLRLSLRYANTDTLEKGYGINLMALASFALEVYKKDRGVIFNPKVEPDQLLNESDQWLKTLMHKAITIIQFKLEGQLISNRPEFEMHDRLLLGNLDLKENNVEIDGEKFELRDSYLPTIDPSNPFKLTDEEHRLVDLLRKSFVKSERLQRHINLLFEKGSMYKVTNGNLLFHGCIPLIEDGQFREVDLGRGKLKGRPLMDFFNSHMMVAYSGTPGSKERSYALDLVWYLWAGPFSPLFGKDKMATFERYFINDESLQKENKDYYYDFRNSKDTCRMILKEFGLDPETSVILNGHVPVNVKKGETPVKAEGKLIVIDGSFSKAYQNNTGLAGYTLIHDCYGRHLIAHEPFISQEFAITEGADIAYSKTILDQSEEPQTISNYDEGHRAMRQIDRLTTLLNAYSNGILSESSNELLRKNRL